MKANIKKIDFNKVIAVANSEPADSIASMILKLRNARIFAQLSPWMTNYDVGDAVESVRSAMDCYALLCTYEKTQKAVAHPVYALDRVLATTAVSFTPVKVVKSDDKDILSVKKGILVTKGDPEPIIIAASYVSDILTYYSRGAGSLGNGSLSTVIDEVKARSLGIAFADVIRLRSALENYTRSVTMARDEMYMLLRDSLETSMYMMSKVCALFPGHHEKNQALTDLMSKYYDNAGVATVDRIEVLLPYPGKIKVCASTDFQVAWQFLHASRQTRGEDNNGIGAITAGYYFFSMPRGLAKNLSIAYDLRAICRHFDVFIIVKRAYMTEYAIRILIANGITIVETENMSLRKFIRDTPGFYRTLPLNEKAMIFKSASMSAPVVRKKTIDWPKLKLKNILVTEMNGSQPMIPFLYVYLVPSIMKEVCSLFPSCMPHNGRVIITTLVNGGFTANALTARMCISNSYRNAFPYNRVPYSQVDPCSEYLKPLEVMMLPRTVETRTQEDLFKLDYVDAVALIEDNVDIPLERRALFSKATPAVRVQVSPQSYFDKFVSRYKDDEDAFAGFVSGTCYEFSAASHLNYNKLPLEEFFSGTPWEPFLKKKMLMDEIEKVAKGEILSKAKEKDVAEASSDDEGDEVFEPPPPVVVPVDPADLIQNFKLEDM